jgi:hypothetical protein
MSSRRLNGGVLVIGLLFAVSPLYWDFLRRLGVTGYFDWLGTIGAIPSGMYYFAVGLLYLSAGIITLIYATGQKRTSFRLYIGTSILLLVVWGVLFVWWPSGMTMDLRSIAVAFAIGPVLVCLPLGAASDRSTRRVVGGIAIGLLIPYASVTLATASARGGPATLGGFFTMFSLVLFAVLDAIWGYPLYRLGQSLRQN